VSPALHDLAHLAKRFAGSLTAQPLSSDEQEWVQQHLIEGERRLWQRMSVADQRHAHGVALRVAASLGAEATRPVMAAALLHDIGKVESGLGTFGRSAATVLANAGVKSQRVAQYRAHNEIGRRLLEDAGSDRLTSSWAYEHELDRARWTLPSRVAQALHAADDD
jgi:response regulator RpfG family c-di-GMP phosphodiesterase